MKTMPISTSQRADLPDCNGQPEICGFLETEGRSALVGYFRKRAPWDQAEDLAHDAFIKAWTRCLDLRESDRAKPWLFGIARNHLIDHYRRTAKLAETSSDSEWTPSEDNESEATAFREELASQLRANLHLLPPEQQPVISALLDGERQVDIARRLKLPLSTVKTRTQRARQRILDFANAQCAFERDAFGRVVDCESKTSDCCA